MIMLESVKNNHIIKRLFIVAMIIIIFKLSGGIIISIFNIGQELGRARAIIW